MNTREIWRDVPSKPQLEASSWGRIKRKPHKVKMPRGGFRTHISEPTYGYEVAAVKNATHTRMIRNYRGIGTVKVHRVVCEAFHGPPPRVDSVVIHRDENGINNREGNLKWGTQRENLNMPKIKMYHRSRVGLSNPHYVGKMQPVAT